MAIRQRRILTKLLTIIESSLFSKLWPDYWSAKDRGEFAAFLANNPEAGEIISGSGVCRKVRWTRVGSGKRSGVRIIYTPHLAYGSLVLLTIYSKSAKDSIPAYVLRKIAEEMGYVTP